MNEFELELLRILEGLRNGIFNNIFKYISVLGQSAVSFVLIALFYFVLNKEYAKKLVYVLSTSTSINGVFKNFVRRTRPFSSKQTSPITCVYPDTATGYSFPSGHSQNISATTTSVTKEYKKKWMIILTIVLISLVGFSRMYLGAHYPSDVIVGIVLGIGCAFLGDYLYKKFGYKKAFLFTVLFLLPFVIYFSFTFKELSDANESLQKDFYSGYGMLLGSFLGLMFEEKYVNFELNKKIWKRIVEMVIALGIALGLKAVLKLPYENANIATWLRDILDLVRYTIVCFVTLGVAPLIFKKINL